MVMLTQGEIMRVSNQSSVTNKQTFGMAFLPPKHTTMMNSAELRAMRQAATESSIAKMAKDFDVQISRYIQVARTELREGKLFPDTFIGESAANIYIKRNLMYIPPIKLEKTHHYLITVSKANKTAWERFKNVFGLMPKGTALSKPLPEPPSEIKSSEMFVYELEDIATEAEKKYLNHSVLRRQQRKLAQREAQIAQNEAWTRERKALDEALKAQR